MYLRVKIHFRNISCCSFLLVSILLPVLVSASSTGFSGDFYRQIYHFLKSGQTRSEPLAQEAHQIVQHHLIKVTENRESFIKKVKELKAYLRLVYDLSELKTLQRTLLLEKEINAHVESLNQETRRKRGAITWAALAIGAIAGVFGAIIGTLKEDNLNARRLKEIGINILIWAPLTIGGGLGLAHLITAKEIEERQALLIHPAELIRTHPGDVAMYEIESYLKAFLAAKNEALRSQTRKKLHAFYSKAPEQVEARIQYMKEVLEYAPQKLAPSKGEQQRQLQALQEKLSLHPLSSSSWDELRYFLSDYMYGFAVAGAFIGVVIFLLSLHLSGGWSWPSLILSFLIGLNVGLSVGQMTGDLIQKETAQEILHYEVLF